MYKPTLLYIYIDTAVDVGHGLVDCNTPDYYVYIYTTREEEEEERLLRNCVR